LLVVGALCAGPICCCHVQFPSQDRIVSSPNFAAANFSFSIRFSGASSPALLEFAAHLGRAVTGALLVFVSPARATDLLSRLHFSMSLLLPLPCLCSRAQDSHCRSDFSGLAVCSGAAIFFVCRNKFRPGHRSKIFAFPVCRSVSPAAQSSGLQLPFVFLPQATALLRIWPVRYDLLAANFCWALRRFGLVHLCSC
jgi:hypothetical protein